MSKVLHPNKNEFENIVKEGGVVFVDFYADWCGPCKMLGPEIEKLADAYDGKAKVIKVNVDKEQALAMDFQVSSIPALFVIKNGSVVAKAAGYSPFPALAKMIDQNL
ncbi:MAG: thioredoxin [Erysipelotrichia bacterium]|nr:thioredoxin [Erysipelotrichia bacterium]NCC54514.1 thioredoxin [Erysipelotrichia bacterium]